MTEKTCLGPNCPKKPIAKGVCSGHYRQLKEDEPLTRLRSYIKTDDLEVRLRHYAPRGNPDDCWEWTAALNKGYGMIAVANSKLRGAHIVAWEIANSQTLPQGALVRHTCDNPPCTNPNHLRVGTHADNSDDKVERDRQAKGERNGTAKLTESEVIQIREALALGTSQYRIADQFGIAQQTVSAIATGILWSWL